MRVLKGWAKLLVAFVNIDVESEQWRKQWVKIVGSQPTIIDQILRKDPECHDIKRVKSYQRQFRRYLMTIAE